MMGAAFEQVLTKYSESKSRITVGNRVVMYYPRERIVLRDGIVVEVEQTAAEPVRRSEPAPVLTRTTPAAPAPGSGPAGPGSAAPAGAGARAEIMRTADSAGSAV